MDRYLESFVVEADRFAAMAHQGYMAHAREVMFIIASVPHTKEMLAAALLHEVVDDGKVALSEISARFGDDVAGMVSDLSAVSRPEDGNRVARKAKELAHTAQISPKAKTIRLADIISNASTIVKRNPGFARIYLGEKAAQLGVLRGGNADLMARARLVLEKATREAFADEIDEFKERLQIRLEYDIRQAARNGNVTSLGSVSVPPALLRDKGMPDWVFSLLRSDWQQAMCQWVLGKLNTLRQQETAEVA